MHSFIYEVGYRIVALAACIYCGRRVWYGAVERKITMYNTDWWDWWTPDFVFPRDTMPIRYWMMMVMAGGSTVLCFLATILGYYPPGT
jgi:hypothetical protein